MVWEIIGWVIYMACASITGVLLWRDEIKHEIKIGLGFLIILIMLSVLWPLIWICRLMVIADRKIIVYKRRQ